MRATTPPKVTLSSIIKSKKKKKRKHLHTLHETLHPLHSLNSNVHRLVRNRQTIATIIAIITIRKSWQIDTETKSIENRRKFKEIVDVEQPGTFRQWKHTEGNLMVDDSDLWLEQTLKNRNVKTFQLIKRAQTQKYVIPEPKSKDEQARTAFTDEDFRKFEREYFCGWLRRRVGRIKFDWCNWTFFIWAAHCYIRWVSERLKFRIFFFFFGDNTVRS